MAVDRTGRQSGPLTFVTYAPGRPPLTSAFTRRGVGTLHLAVVCAVVGVFVALYLVWWFYCFTFAVWPVAWVGHRRARNVAGLLLFVLATAAGAGGRLSDVLSVGALVLGVGAGCLATWRRMQANAALHAATADQARTAVAEERLRFARDLHDLLGHSLSLIALKSEVASRLLPGDPGRAGPRCRGGRGLGDPRRADQRRAPLRGLPGPVLPGQRTPRSGGASCARWRTPGGGPAPRWGFPLGAHRARLRQLGARRGPGHGRPGPRHPPRP